jgi:DNA primase large subunit
MMEEQGRIAPLLKAVHHVSTSASVNPQQHALDAVGNLTASSIDSVLVPHMPLCMQQIHKGLQRDGKIRHWARLQYGLFLKGAGLSMEESLRFFQAKFHALTSPDQFNKEYAYNIRHMYGKEGKRANYTPYSCTKIILGNAPPVTREDHHGCPFRHCDDANLSRLLWDHVKLHNSKTAATAPPMVAPDAANRAAIQEILQLKRANHYQLACVKHFELLHPTNSRSKHASTAEVGNHPNAWLAASVAYSSISLNESQIDVPVKSSPDDLSQLVGQDNAVTEESMMMNEE